MQNGDRAGLAVFRNSSAWIGIKRDNGATRVVMTNGLTMDRSNNWATSSTGSEQASATVTGGRIWLRATADIRPGSAGRQATFSYSTNGTTFTPLGNALILNNEWYFFMGYRLGAAPLEGSCGCGQGVVSVSCFVDALVFLVEVVGPVVVEVVVGGDGAEFEDGFGAG
jgi:hypothetical protein